MTAGKKIELLKWPFYMGDFILIAFGLTVLFMGEGEPNWGIILLSIVSVALGATLFCIPYIIEYRQKVKWAQMEREHALSGKTEHEEAFLESLTAIHGEVDYTMEKLERNASILDSLIRRMEARLRQGNAEGTVHEDVVEFEEDAEHQKAEEQNELDIRLEVEEGFFDNESNSDENENAGSSVTITAMVQLGIGSTPYLRGDGGGLSGDKGVPMEYTSLGQWQWISENATEPLHVQIYKDDEVAADEEPFEIAPGQSVEIHPHFQR